MSSKNQTAEEQIRRDRRRIHRINNAKNPDNFKKLKKRRHGVGRRRQNG